MEEKELWAESFPYDGPRNIPLGLIQGSGTWGVKFPQEAEEPDVEVLWEGVIETPYPRNAEMTLRQSPKLQHLQVEDREVLSVVSHGWQSNQDPVEFMGSQKIFWVFRKAGVKWVIGGGTCGLLNNAIWPGDLVIPYDFIDLTTRRVVGLPGTELEFPMFKLLLRMRQAICPSIAYAIEKAAERLNFGRVYRYSNELIHITTEGPWFETPAQVQKLRRDGGDTVGQSLATEANLARVCGMHIAFAHYGVNPAEGLLPKMEWELDEVHHRLRLDMAKLHLRSLKVLQVNESCGCMDYRIERPKDYQIGL